MLTCRVPLVAVLRLPTRYVMFFDDDDLMVPEAMHTMVACAAVTGADIVTSWVQVCVAYLRRWRWSVAPCGHATASLASPLYRGYLRWCHLALRAAPLIAALS